MSTASQSTAGSSAEPTVRVAPWPGGVTSTLQSGEGTRERVYFATSSGWSEAFIPQDDAATGSSDQAVSAAATSATDTSATDSTGGCGTGKV